MNLEEAHKHCRCNKNELEQSKKCGCFYCLSIFELKSYDNLEWVGREKTTLLCPKCSIDSVIGDASGIKLTNLFLKKMYERWVSYENRIKQSQFLRLRKK
ncbi:MAG: cytoplasmic protein [Crenarchaeota archaeon]|nr:MAG: cytoplasmic protein [Thermoproteota archaeon]